MEQVIDKKSASRLLNSSKQELSAWLETLDQLILLYETDTTGRITDLNNNLEQVSQYTRKELMGSPCHLLRHHEMPKALFKLLWKTIHAGQPFKGIVKNRKKDGSSFWVELAIMPVKDANHRIVKYVCASHLIHEERVGQGLYLAQMSQLNLPWKEDLTEEGTFMMAW
jgi:PAS domain S-box-containing protein